MFWSGFNGTNSANACKVYIIKRKRKRKGRKKWWGCPLRSPATYFFHHCIRGSVVLHPLKYWVSEMDLCWEFHFNIRSWLKGMAHSSQFSWGDGRARFHILCNNRSKRPLQDMSSASMTLARSLSPPIISSLPAYNSTYISSLDPCSLPNSHQDEIPNQLAITRIKLTN